MPLTDVQWTRVKHAQSPSATSTSRLRHPGSSQEQRDLHHLQPKCLLAIGVGDVSRVAHRFAFSRPKFHDWLRRHSGQR